MKEYPGDLILRTGRRVCRKSGWVDPIPLNDAAKDGCSLWCCGKLVYIQDEDTATVETLLGELWGYPLRLLQVEHSQEDMTDAQYLFGLHRLRQIVERDPISGYDDATIGNKSTECNWGFCSENKEIWPIGQPRRSNDRPCPLDRRRDKRMGCFYRCRFFCGKIARDRALSLFDELILSLNNRKGEIPCQNKS